MYNKKSFIVILLSMFVLMGATYPTSTIKNTKPTTKNKTNKLTNKYAKKLKTVKSTATNNTKSAAVVKTNSQPMNSKVNNIHAKAKQLDLKVLKLGVKAHQQAKSKKVTKTNIISIIDYSKPSTEKRFWVIDLENEKVLFNDFVAHGKNSGAKMAKTFSNVPGSLTSSIGVFLTSESYMGSHGYSMRLDGLEKGVNDNARSRAIVMHGADYVSANLAKQIGRLGRSWGCPALPHGTSKKVIDTIKNGSLLLAYYPDNKWLKSSKFVG